MPKLPRGLTLERYIELQQIVANAIEREKPTHIVGVDEVGYGACAGPLVIGAVYVPVDWKSPAGLTDSKMMSDPEIERLANLFGAAAEKSTDLHFSLWRAASDTIDEEGLGRARTRLLRQAVESTVSLCQDSTSGKVLAFADGNLDIEGSVSVVKADFVIPAVSMAAVMAKYDRDAFMMREMETLYPGYGFRSHVGYDVPEHRAALQKLGPCAIHRKSNATVRSHVKLSNPLTDMLMNGDFDD
jgi:ribonuclease HII